MHFSCSTEEKKSYKVRDDMRLNDKIIIIIMIIIFLLILFIKKSIDNILFKHKKQNYFIYLFIYIIVYEQ